LFFHLKIFHLLKHPHHSLDILESSWWWLDIKNKCLFVWFVCLHVTMSQSHFEGSVRSSLTLPKMGLGSPPGLLKIRIRLQGPNTSHWNVLYTVGKVLKCRCPKWPHMSHLDIYNTSYSWKKGRKSNWQFDSWPLKVGNRPNPSVCRWSATHHWKALKESYKFSLDLIPIRGRNEKLWMPKVSKIQTGTISGLHFGSPGKKCHSNASAAERHKEYYMGESGGFPWIQAVVNQMSPRLLMACPNTESVPNVN
jgi:hypothetical protein